MAQARKPAQRRGAAKRGHKKHAPKNWRKRFMARLGETSNVSAAAEAAGISISHIYALRRKDSDFARQWFDALAEGYDNLEMELLQHLRAGGEGSGEAGETAPAPKKKFDAATAFRCLAAHRESVAREKGRRTRAEEVATIAAINEKIDRLRLNGKAATTAIAQARKGNRERLANAGDSQLLLPGPGEAGTAAAAGQADAG